LSRALDAAEPGAELARDTYPAVTRYALAMYAGASGDDNPIHLDIDHARAAGFPDVFAHGMLIMGYLGRTLRGVAGTGRLISFSTRFSAITWVGNEITCIATLSGREDTDRGPVATITLVAADQHGEVKLKGEATVGLE
jgi:acyl dehydratase